MIDSVYYLYGSGTDPYANLALEKLLLDTVLPGSLILYLWQNADTVVIGRNQDCYGECRVTELEAAGGRLARRLSGGGAVYHDLGNLNFTFLARRENYDVSRQLDAVLNSLNALGVNGEKSGRNDLTVNGRKFSGNAFYRSGDNCYHHGTILLDADMDKLTRYLYVPEDKLAAKGVNSVRARVVNLIELVPELTVERMREAMVYGLSRVYGKTPELYDEGLIDRGKAEAERARFASDAWRYGRGAIAGARCIEHRFTWGGVRIELAILNGLIRDAAVFSDAMDAEIIASMPDVLRGPAADAPSRLASLGSNIVVKDITALLDKYKELI